jgi:hypothetical protein
VQELAEAITQVEQTSKRFYPDVEQSSFGPALRRHIRELQRARNTYGPIGVRQARS